MTFEPIPGLIFTFTQDGGGLVTDITVPDIPVGLITIPGYVLHLNTAQTVAGAQQLVTDFLTMLGLL